MPRAIGIFEAGVRLAPNHREMSYNLGRAYEKSGRPRDAERLFHYLVQGRDMKQARVRLGALAEGRGDPIRAAGEYRRALEIGPSYPEALRHLGLLRLGAGERREGVALLKRYLAIRPGDSQVAELVAEGG